MIRKLLYSFSMFSGFCYSQPGLNAVYINSAATNGSNWANSIYLNEVGPLTISHSVQCDTCDHHQRITFHQFDFSGQLISQFNLGDDDTNYILFGLAKNRAFESESSQLVLAYNTLESGWQSERNHIAVHSPEGAVLSDTIFDIRDDSDWLLFGTLGGLTFSENKFMICGIAADSTNYFEQSPSKGGLMLIDDSGTIYWRTMIEDSRIAYNLFSSQNVGEYWVAASEVTSLISYDITNPVDALIIKVDSLGQEIFRHPFGGYGNDGIAGIIEEPDRLVVAGFETYEEPIWPFNQSVSSVNGYIFVRSYLVDQSGLSLDAEKKVFDCASQNDWDVSEKPAGFRASQNGDFIIWGDGYIGWDNGALGQHGFLTRISHELDTLWFRRYLHPQFIAGMALEGGGAHEINDIAEAPDGSIYMVGHILGYSPPDYPELIEHLWLLHVDEYGCLEPGCHLVGTEEIITHMTETMSVYPNPARDNCTIAFSLIDGYTAPAQSELKLTDMQGRIVRTIALSGAEVAGGKVQMDLGGLASGMYVAHWMDGGRWMDSVKIVVE